jgi:very-short-patch-repair endonuclease
MDKIELEKYIKEGLSARQISSKCGLSRSTVCYWIGKHEFSTNFKSHNKPCRSKYELMDWGVLQKLHDEGRNHEELIKLGYSQRSILWGKSHGKLKLRNRSESCKLEQTKKKRIHSNETKEKISKSRIRYLTDNPDKVPYKLNHSSKKSYPEEVFENALMSSGITGWIYNYQNGIYCYDFAFVNKKIDVEIDGGTHLSEKVIKIDKRRDEFSKSQGWTVVRFTAKEVKTDVIKCIETLKKILTHS